jgi:hypothetical protein
MSQSSTTLPSQAPVSAAVTLLASAKERIKDLMACLPDGGVAEEADVETWGKRFAGLLVSR